MLSAATSRAALQEDLPKNFYEESLWKVDRDQSQSIENSIFYVIGD